MSAPTTIEVLIQPDGEVTVQTRGFTGSGCLAASRFLEQALGQKVAEQRTPEFYGQATVLEQAKQKS